MCVYMEERSVFSPFASNSLFLLTLPDPPSINVDGMMCN